MTEYKLIALKEALVQGAKSVLELKPEKVLTDEETVLVFHEEDVAIRAVKGMITPYERPGYLLLQRINFRQSPHPLTDRYTFTPPRPALKSLKRLLGSVPFNLRHILLLQEQNSASLQVELRIVQLSGLGVVINGTFYVGYGRVGTFKQSLVWDAQFYVHEIIPEAQMAGRVSVYQDTLEGRLSISGEPGKLSLAEEEK